MSIRWFCYFIFLILNLNKAYTSQLIEKVIDKLYFNKIQPQNIYWIDVVQGKCNINTFFTNEKSLSVNYQFTSQSNQTSSKN